MTNNFEERCETGPDKPAVRVGTFGSDCDVHGISDPEYSENPEIGDVDFVSRIYERFKGTGQVLPEPQFRMYQAIRDSLSLEVRQHPQFPNFIWSSKVIDVGCGCGIGSNILSSRAEFVWGIDKNSESICYARQMFERTKNEVYWSPQLSFDIVDVTKEPRDLATFDVVVCIEVIEHLADHRPLLSFLRRCGIGDATYFVSSPNRAAWSGTPRARKPLNPYHIREWNAQELKMLLRETFSDVELCDCNLTPVSDNTTQTPVLARCKA